MSGVFRTIDPLTARRVCTPPPLVRREDTLAIVQSGWGVNSTEDARHCSVLYICKYFVVTKNVLSCLFNWRKIVAVEHMFAGENYEEVEEGFTK